MQVYFQTSGSRNSQKKNFLNRHSHNALQHLQNLQNLINCDYKSLLLTSPVVGKWPGQLVWYVNLNPALILNMHSFHMACINASIPDILMCLH